MTKPMLVLSYIWGVFIKGIVILYGLLAVAYCCYKGVLPSSISLIISIVLIGLYLYLTVQETIWLCEFWREVDPITHKYEIE